MIYDPQQKSETLANSLQSRFNTHPDITDTAHTTQITHDTNLYLQVTPKSKIPLTSPQEVRQIIKTLKTNKATGPDGIPTKALKQLPRKSIVHLTKIYNACLKYSHFPTQWKEATIITLPKPGKDPTKTSNYRPISLLNYLGKILEKVIATRINQNLKDPNKVQDEQFGFKAGHSTKDPLLRLTNYIKDSYQHFEHTVATFLDIKQAFDTVWHAGLIWKLKTLKIPDAIVHIIANYLKNRSFRVKTDNHLSKARIMEAGVAQGSTLSPLLYAIYVQDMPKHDKCLHSLYADDTVLYTKHVDIKIACRAMQDQLDAITQWSTKWKLKINGDKSNTIIFTRRYPKLQDTLQIQNQKIPYNTIVKYLGIILDSRLAFRTHIQTIRDGAFQRYMSLYPIFKGHTTLKIKRLIYTQLIRAYMTYGCEIWAQAHRRHIQKLNAIQRQICRTITDTDYHITNLQLYNDMEIEHFINLIEYRRQNYLQKLTTHLNPLMRAEAP